MLRLFVAIAIPAEVRDALSTIQTDMAGARWSPPANMHLTLRFIGEVAKDQAVAIERALSEVAVPKMVLRIDGLGTFPERGSPRVLFARVVPEATLVELQGEVERALRRAGVEADERPYRPHVTLARLRDPVRRAVAALVRQNDLTETFTARSFVLMRSHLTPGGTRHEVVARYPAPP